MHRYDIAGDRWTAVERALPEPVSVALCFALGGKIVMFGGEVTPSERGHAGAGNFRYIPNRENMSLGVNFHYTRSLSSKTYLDIWALA